MVSIRIVEQLSLFVENRVGALAAICASLAEAHINIYGISMSDTGDCAVVRLIVSDSRKALAVFEAHGVLVVESDILMIENSNSKSNDLPQIIQMLAKEKISIGQCSLASLPSHHKGILFLRVKDAKKAMRLIESSFS